MLSYAWLTLWRQRSRAVFASGGFLLAACALILLSATTQTTVVRANQLISQEWRSTYDLVVLPPQAKIPTGTAVPADLLEGYSGGISAEQYAAIQQIPGVAIAAPIAFIGYAQLPVPTVQFSSQPLAPGYYRLDWTLSSSNGQKTIVERQQTAFYLNTTSCGQFSDTKTFDALAQQNVQELACSSSDVPADFPSIDTGVFLLAGIDPTAEDQLVHLNQAIVSGRMLNAQDTLKQNTTQIPGVILPPTPRYDLPLLFNTQLPGQITLSARLTQVASDSLTFQQVLARGGFRYLSGLRPQTQLFAGNVPLAQSSLQRFDSAMVLWNGQSWSSQSFPGGNYATFLYAPTALTYQSATPPPGQPGPAYLLEPASDQNPNDALNQLKLARGANGVNDYASEQGPEVAYRSLIPLQKIGGDTALYQMQFVGSYAGSAVSAQFSDALNWLPETTYAAPPTVLKFDAQGRPIKPVTLQPTTNQAGALLQPPLALTTLSAAEKLMGDKAISVIRIRVSGVSSADNASWQRIEKVAQLIEQRTGLHALVTLGSSPRPTLVYLSGVSRGQDHSTRDIAPQGWVEERWIALGAALVYLGQLGALRLLILGATLFVCLGYTSITLSSLAGSQRKEMAILSALGWRPGAITRVFLAQALALALVGGAIGVAVALAGVFAIGASPPWPIVAAALPATLVLALVSALYPLLRLRRLRPAEALHAGIITGGEAPGATGRAGRAAPRALSPTALLHALSPVTGMAARNLLRSRLRALIAIASLFFSAILLIVVITSILSLRATLQGTLLGNAVLLQTAAPQLAGGVFAVLLTFASVADLLLLQVRERQQEIGILQAFGWRPALINSLFVQEGVFLASVGATLGGLAAVAIVISQHSALSDARVALIVVGTVVFLIGVAALAALPAIRAIGRLQVMDVLRSE